MNYIRQIKYFWKLHEEYSFSSNEIALYFYLLELCNILSWKDIFKRNNAKICADLNISKVTLENSRKKLKESELIQYKTLNGSANVEYTIKKDIKNEVCNEVCNEVNDEVTNEVSVQVANEVNMEVFNEVESRLVHTKDKLNLNQTKHIDIEKINKKEIPKNEFSENNLESNSTSLQTENLEKEKRCAKKEKSFNFKNKLLEYGAKEELVNEWIRIRNIKKAINSEHSLNIFLSELQKCDKTINEVLEILIHKQWKGFEAKWIIQNNNFKNEQNTKYEQFRKPIIGTVTDFGKL